MGANMVPPPSAPARKKSAYSVQSDFACDATIRQPPTTDAASRQMPRIVSRSATYPMTTLPTARPINPKEFMPATSERSHPSAISIGRKKAVTPLTSVPMMTASIVAAEPTANQDIDILQLPRFLALPTPETADHPLPWYARSKQAEESVGLKLDQRLAVGF